MVFALVEITKKLSQHFIPVLLESKMPNHVEWKMAETCVRSAMLITRGKKRISRKE